MSGLTPNPGENLAERIEERVEERRVHELQRLQSEWWYFLLLGVLLVIGGIAAITYPWFTTIGVVVFLGAVLILSGVATIISAFWAGKWSAFLVQVLIGLLYVVAGYVVTDAPLTSAAMLTLMLAAFLVVGGGFRIVSALVDKYPQWGWSLLNGVISLMLGLIIFRAFRQLPEEPTGVFWILGLLVGVEILFNGWTWIMLSLAIRKLPKADEAGT
jgi:uncharacterized membrane protein HdeD (DUF308 family)